MLDAHPPIFTALLLSEEHKNATMLDLARRILIAQNPNPFEGEKPKPRQKVKMPKANMGDAFGRMFITDKHSEDL